MLELWRAVQVMCTAGRCRSRGAVSGAVLVCWEELRALAVAEMSCGEMSAVRQRGCGATSGRDYVAGKETGSRGVQAGDG